MKEEPRQEGTQGQESKEGTCSVNTHRSWPCDSDGPEATGASRSAVTQEPHQVLDVTFFAKAWDFPITPLNWPSFLCDNFLKMCDTFRDTQSYPAGSTATQKLWCHGNYWQEKNMKMYTLVKLPNVLKSAVPFKEQSVILANRSVLGSKWLCSNCYRPTGQKKALALKKWLNFLLFIMMEKCHQELNVLSVEKRGCLKKAGDPPVEMMATLDALLTARELERQVFCALEFSSFFFFLFNWRIFHLLTYMECGIVWDKPLGLRRSTLLTAECHRYFSSVLSK